MATTYPDPVDSSKQTHIDDHNAIALDVASRAKDAEVVKLAGNQVVSGTKSFSIPPKMAGVDPVLDTDARLKSVGPSATGTDNVFNGAGSTVQLPDAAKTNINRVFLTSTTNTPIAFPIPSAGVSFRLAIIQDSTGNRPYTLPNVQYGSGAVPAHSTAANAIDLYDCLSIDGFNWFVQVVALGIVAPQATSNLILDNITQTPTVAWGLSKLRANYTGNCIKVRRSSDSTTQNIGFSGNNLDTAALTSFCGSGDGFIDTWYDQSGNGYNLVNTTAANQYRIVGGGAVDSKGGKPSAYVPSETTGYIVTVPTYNGGKLSGVLVGTQTSTATSSTYSPQIMTVAPAGATSFDPSGAYLIARKGGSTPAGKWATQRQGTWESEADAIYNTLQHVAAVYTGSSAQLFVDNSSGALYSESRTYGLARIGLGHTGSAYQSCPGGYISEAFLFEDELTSTNRVAMQNNQAARFGTPATASNVGGGDGVTAPTGLPGTWVLDFEDTFSGSTIDTTKWRTTRWFDTDGTGSSNDGNKEDQLYLASQVLVGGGECKLRAEVANPVLSKYGNTYHYKSGMINTGPSGGSNTNHKYKFTYGFLEGRMWVPKGAGNWPALWTEGEYDGNHWPPEPDVMEILGGQPTTVQMHFHSGTSSANHVDNGGAWTGPDFSTGWHTFGMDWTPNWIRWYVDGVERRAAYTDTSKIPNIPLYIIANLAIGSGQSWGGAPTSSTVFPSDLRIDYIRVWKRAS